MTTPSNVAPLPARLGRLRLDLEVTDPDVLEELRRQPDEQRAAYAQNALRIGVLALRSASGQLDAAAVKEAGTRLVADLRETLLERGKDLTRELGTALAQYLDPRSGALASRIDALVRDGGELAHLLDAHVGADGSVLAQALARHLGEQSPIFRMLSPTDANGLRAQLASTLERALDAQRAAVVREFSLDDKASALSRLVSEVGALQGALRDDVKAQVGAVVKEFSLDQQDSALSRLVARVEATQRQVADQFSADNDQSALSRMTRLLDRTSDQIGRNLTLDDPASALSRLKRELQQVIDELGKRNAEFQADVRETLAKLESRREAEARGAAHGATFEDALCAAVAAEAARLGDVAERTGATVGLTRNCKVGDAIVTLGPDCAAAGARIVFEAKEDQSYALRDALAELETARKNRGAQLGVFVFSARTAPEGTPAFARYHDDFVVVWDAEDPASDVVLQAAYSAARALAVREGATSAERAEALHEIERAVRQIEKRVEELDAIRVLASTVQGHGQKIGERVDRMRADLAAQVAAMDEHVRALRAGGER
jgi:uncharacterized protein YeeX (DUF496 family)/citrate lyase gamma subunit